MRSGDIASARVATAAGFPGGGSALAAASAGFSSTIMRRCAMAAVSLSRKNCTVSLTAPEKPGGEIRLSWGRSFTETIQ